MATASSSAAAEGESKPRKEAAPQPGPRPKSANPFMDQALRYRLWQSTPHGTVHTHTTYTGVDFPQGQKGPLGEPLAGGYLETTRKTITEESEVLWAMSSSGLDERLIRRPKTSNPTYSACSTPPASRTRRGSADSSSLRRDSELLWAERSPPPESAEVHVARPCTSNPTQDSLFCFSPQSKSPPTGSAILWASDGGVATARPRTFNPQLSEFADGERPGAAPVGSEVLWSSDGGVSPQPPPPDPTDPGTRPPAMGTEVLFDGEAVTSEYLTSGNQGGETDPLSPVNGSRAPPCTPATLIRPVTSNPRLTELLRSGGTDETPNPPEVLWCRSPSSCPPPAAVERQLASPNAASPASPAAAADAGEPTLRELLLQQSDVIQRQNGEIAALQEKVDFLQRQMANANGGRRVGSLPHTARPATAAAVRPQQPADGRRPPADRPMSAPAERPMSAPARRLPAGAAGSALRRGPNAAALGQLCKSLAGSVANEQQMRFMYDELCSRCRTADGGMRLTRATFREWYSTLETFGVEHNVDAEISGVVGTANTIEYTEFAILMLRLAKL